MPAEEETDSRDPYHYPWSGVDAKTPQTGLRVLWVVGGILGRFQGGQRMRLLRPQSVHRRGVPSGYRRRSRQSTI